MEWIKSVGKKIKVDDEGFLGEITDWDEQVAKKLASREGIKFLRAYHAKFNAFPILNYVCKNIHQPKECVNERIY